MVCFNCGKKLPDNAVKCNKCGTVFKAVEQNTEMEDYLKKEKEKAAQRAQRLEEKKQKEKATIKKEKKPVNKKLFIIIAVVSTVIMITTVLTVLAVKNVDKEKLAEKDTIAEKGKYIISSIFDKGNKDANESKAPELNIEYTFVEESADNALMTLGGINIGNAEYEFFYRQSYSNTQNAAMLALKEYVGAKLGEKYDDNKDYYGEYFAEFLKEKPNTFDYTKPINNQPGKALDENGKEITWEQYIRNDAVKTLAGYRIKYDLALKSGMELTDDIKYQVYNHIEGLRGAVTGGGYQSLDQYLQILFGEKCDEEFFKNELIREYMAAKYDIVNNDKTMLGYSENYIKSEYEKNSKAYDFVDIYVYEATGDNAEIVAKKILSATTNVDDFTAAIKKNVNDTADKTPLPVVPKYYVDQNYSEELGNWAFDRSRKATESSVFKTQNGYTVVVIQNPAYTRQNCISYREIVFSKTDSQGTAYTQQELTQIKQKAQEIYKQWKDDGADENTFAYLAMKESNSENGGLVPYASSDELNPQLKQWAKTNGLKQGDNAFIESDDAYRIVYLVNNYGDYWNYAIRSTKAAEDTAKEINKLKITEYKNSYDENLLKKTEGEFIEVINKLYLGIGA